MATTPYSLAHKDRQKSGEAKDKSDMKIEGNVVDETEDKLPSIPSKTVPTLPTDDPFRRYRSETT